MSKYSDPVTIKIVPVMTKNRGMCCEAYEIIYLDMSLLDIFKGMFLGKYAPRKYKSKLISFVNDAGKYKNCNFSDDGSFYQTKSYTDMKTCLQSVYGTNLNIIEWRGTV